MTTTIIKTTTVTTRYERTVTVADILHALGAPVHATLSTSCSNSGHREYFDAEDTFDLTWTIVEETQEPPCQLR